MPASLGVGAGVDPFGVGAGVAVLPLTAAVKGPAVILDDDANAETPSEAEPAAFMARKSAGSGRICGAVGGR